AHPRRAGGGRDRGPHQIGPLRPVPRGGGHLTLRVTPARKALLAAAADLGHCGPVGRAPRHRRDREVGDGHARTWSPRTGERRFAVWAAMTEAAKERWASGDLYEPYVGRWSRLVARDFLDWLDAPAGLDWLDVGCGTGALAEAVAGRCRPKSLAGIDPSADFLDFARRRLAAAGADLRQADARDLPFAPDTFDRVVSGLVLNFVPEPEQGAAEMARVARPDGEVALYV